MGRPVIVLEFNELTPALMERFIAGGHLPAFSRLRSQSVACVTDSEEVAPNLEPWIQWVTVHTGRSYQEHGVFQLGDGPTGQGPENLGPGRRRRRAGVGLRQHERRNRVVQCRPLAGPARSLVSGR